MGRLSRDLARYLRCILVRVDRVVIRNIPNEAGATLLTVEVMNCRVSNEGLHLLICQGVVVHGRATVALERRATMADLANYDPGSLRSTADVLRERSFTVRLNSLTTCRVRRSTVTEVMAL